MRVGGSELTKRAARQSWRKIPDGLTTYNWLEGQLRCKWPIEEVRGRGGEKGDPLNIRTLKPAGMRHPVMAPLGHPPKAEAPC